MAVAVARLNRRTLSGKTMTERVRICLVSEDGHARPLLWFCAQNAGELFWSPYGLAANNAHWTHEWPRQLVTTQPRTEQFRYYLANAQLRDRIVDHFSSHADGTFHMKFRGVGATYSHRLRRTKPLAENTDVFLEFSLMSDIATAYASTKKDMKSAVLLPAPLGAGVRLHVAVAGRYFDIVSSFRHAIKPEQAVRRFEFGAFAAVAVASPYWPDVQLSADRFPGTFLSFRFPGQDRLDHLLNLMFV